MNNPSEQRESLICETRVRRCELCDCIYTDGSPLRCPRCDDERGPSDELAGSRLERIAWTALAAFVFVLLAIGMRCGK